MNAHFVNPWVLYFLWLVPAVAAWWVLAYRRREQRLTRFMSAAMQAKLRPSCSVTRQVWQSGLIATGALLLLLAAARPQWGAKEEIVYQRGRDLLIVLDVSRSMLAADVHPNRLQRAKADIMDLIKELRGDRAGLLVFRHKAALLCPLTTDYSYLTQALEAADITSAPRGATDIGDAIQTALDHFDDEEGTHKAIILISDGEDLSGRALKSAEKAAERNIPIFTVGLGDRQGARIPDADGRSGYSQYRGEDVITRLDNQSLYDIAKATGGAYVPVETASMTDITLGTLYRDHLRHIAARDLEESLQRRYVERFQLFLLPGVLLLLAGAYLSRGRLAAGKRIPSSAILSSAGEDGLKDLTPPLQKAKPILVLLGALLVAAAPARGQTNTADGASTNAPSAARDVPPGRAGARIAQRYYRLGQYEDAAAAYLESVKGSTQKSQRDFRYNAAAALFKAGRHKDAADLLRDLEGSGKETSARITMGLGSTLFEAADAIPGGIEDHEKAAERERLLRESGAAFQRAARSDRATEAAGRNLAVADRAWREASEEAKIAALNHRCKDMPPDRIAADMLSLQRDVSEGMIAAFTNEAPSRITDLESLALRQREAADLWIPLKGKLLEAMAQKAQDPEYQQKLAQVETVVETTRDNMLRSASQLEDLDPYAQEAAQASKAAVYYFWKSIAAYPGLLHEDLRLQTNVVDMCVAPPTDDPDKSVIRQGAQDEAGDLTRTFIERFTQAVPEEGLPATPGPEDQPAMDAGGDKEQEEAVLSPEDRKTILDLADEAVSAQESASARLRQNLVKDALTDQRAAYRLLKEVEKLLPKGKQQQQPSDQQKDEQQKKDSQPEPSEQEKPPPQTEEQETDQHQEPQPEQPEDTTEEDATPEDIKTLLQKALQREKEHEAEKRRRQQHIPMGPIDKDW